MAKASKKASPELRAKEKDEKSILAFAFSALQSGDVVTARSLAQKVISGTKGADDDSVAKRLSKELSSAEEAVGELPENVAQAIVDRTIVPPRPYLYAAICLVVFLVLVSLARSRYA